MPTDPLLTLAITDIATDALIRDRTPDPHDPDLAELASSIAATGLRQPIEVFELTGDPPRYGLISGMRRLTAMTRLHTLTGDPKYTKIAAFLRTPATITEAMAAMVAENDLRTDISAWERGRIIVRARNLDHFPNLDTAIEALYPTADSTKRSRLRSLAHLVEELDGLMTAPETLSQRQALRLAASLRAGFTDLIAATLEESGDRTPEAQWTALQPVLEEAELSLRTPQRPTRPDRPRRTLRPRHGIVVRREMTRDGWVLRFTGREATGIFMDGVLDEVERWCR